MKHKLLPIAALAAAGLALTPGHLHATNVPASSGDLILGFEASGSPDDLEVDIGSASLYLNATAPFNVTFGVVPGTSTVVTNLNSDLGIFGSGSTWASNTSLLWGVVGDVFLTGNKYDIFLTQDAADATSIFNPNIAASRTDATGINTLTGSQGIAGSAADAFSTEAAAVPTGNTNSWTSFSPDNTGFGPSVPVEQSNGDHAVGSTLSLYELVPTGSGNASVLGSFSLNGAGDLTFTPAAVPEPSTWASVLAGALFLGFFRLRRGSSLS
jgi:hypothetical protein